MFFKKRKKDEKKLYGDSDMSIRIRGKEEFSEMKAQQLYPVFWSNRVFKPFAFLLYNDPWHIQGK